MSTAQIGAYLHELQARGVRVFLKGSDRLRIEGPDEALDDSTMVDEIVARKPEIIAALSLSVSTRNAAHSETTAPPEDAELIAAVFLRVEAIFNGDVDAAADPRFGELEGAIDRAALANDTEGLKAALRGYEALAIDLFGRAHRATGV